MCKKCLELQQKKYFKKIQKKSFKAYNNKKLPKKCQKVLKSSKKGPTSIKRKENIELIL